MKNKENHIIESSMFLHADTEASLFTGKHVIPTPLSESSTALTYHVHNDGKMFFLKRLKPELCDNEAYRNLFKKEYEVGRELSHQHIVRYEALYNETNDCYLLMEHIQGETLNERIASKPLYFASQHNVKKFVTQLLDGLEYLHKHNILHCDLKPQNVMLTQVNNDVKIIDLGFCLNNSYIDTIGMTREYASPEQVEGNIQEIDHTSDIYCVGKILEYIHQRTHRGLPLLYKRIMHRCLKQKKQQRYGSVEEILQVINRKWWQKKRMWCTIILAVLVGGTIWLNTSTTPQQESLYDIEKYGIGYKILSEENHTCEVVCRSNNNVGDIVIHDKVIFKGDEYKVVSIADSCFVNDTIATSIHIPEGIERIGEGAFIDNKKVNVIRIPNSVKSMGKESFMAMDNLSHLSLGNGIDTICERTFACNFSLTKVVIPEGVRTIMLDAFAGCWNLKEVTLPSTLTTIQRGVFYECTSLEQITIPASVTYIGEYTFYECHKLTKIYNYNPYPQASMPIVKNASMITLYVPKGAGERYRNADFWKEMNIVEMTQ